MAEWSKAQVLDTRLFEGAGSNPVSGRMFLIFIKRKLMTSIYNFYSFLFRIMESFSKKIG